MNWEDYKQLYIVASTENGFSPREIEKNLSYAENLHKKNLPIIYDEVHLGHLIGISYEYMYKVANDATYFYRSFRINKNSGGTRKISEPLPNLKIIQSWILNEILYKVKVHPNAKAYIKGVSLKDNVKFHRNQDTVVKLDIIRFFNNIGEKKVYKIYKDLGYTVEVSWLLTKLCTLNGALPQGAVTSPYLSNLVMRKFDNSIKRYCKRNGIRYTRYADDLTFSGNFHKGFLISKVESQLKKLNLELNKQKIRILKRNQRQIVTGIVVNEKIQVAKSYRKEIRKEVYFINKFGIESHLEKTTSIIEMDNYKKAQYLKSLLGKIEYVLFVNKYDTEMLRYKDEIKYMYNSILNE